MFDVLVLGFLSLQLPGASPSAPGASGINPWCSASCDGAGGAVHASRRPADDDLDPANCSARCLDERYQVAVLTPEGCLCGDWRYGSVAGEGFDTSSRGGDREERRRGDAVNVSAANPTAGITLPSTLRLPDCGCLNGTLVRVCFPATERSEKVSEGRLTSATDLSAVGVELFTLAKGRVSFHPALTADSCSAGEEEGAVFIFNRTWTAEKRGRKSSLQVHPTWPTPTSDSLNESIQIYTEKQAYPTNTEVMFLAVSEDGSDPEDFLWDFGDSSSTRTTSRTTVKKYRKPGRYQVVLVASRAGARIATDVLPLVIQRPVRLNRLRHQASVLMNHAVTVNCRVSAGTDASFLWSFGDGSSRPGESTERHVFRATGEFRVTVTVFNLVSLASLSSHIFVVTRPCRPLAVKNMGPSKLQVRRYEVIRVGVTYEQEVDCGPGGVRYSWTLLDSAGRVFPLPSIDTHRQTLTLPSYLLGYDTYTAVSRVQVIDSVVYSNYSVRVQVIPSPPVASIQGGTNVFTSRNAVVSLDGRKSHDPDFPVSPLSFRWTCEPVSSIPGSCFPADVPASSPVLLFPAGALKRNFDQFRFVLTVYSGERFASSETFITLTPNVIRKASVFCSECQGDRVNWDQSFTVGALCEGCDVAPEHVWYSWSLYLVNASSRPVLEVPLCHAVDLSSPSAIIQAPPTSALPPPVSEASQDLDNVIDPAVVSGFESDFKTRVKNGGVLSGDDREESSLSPGSGEEAFLGDLDPQDPAFMPLHDTLDSDQFDQRDNVSGFPLDPESSADWEFSFPVSESGEFEGRPDVDYDVHLMNVEEGEPGVSSGRPSDDHGELPGPGEYSVSDPEEREDEGSDLVDPRPSVLSRAPSLLDLPRELVEAGLFESYTYTGISSSLLSFRPFSLKHGSRYMLEVTTRSHDSVLGRTQLFLKTNPLPNGMMCQVQPASGFELITHFSIFCTSGKEDLTYKYSLGVGGTAPRTLYQGTDYQYYFSLPSGDPSDDYKVTIYTEIRSSTSGTVTKPCPVSVQVQPSFSRVGSSAHSDPDLELLELGLRNLSALLQLGNSAEVRNYVSLLAGVLNRRGPDDDGNGGGSRARRRARSALICAICRLEGGEQESEEDSISILRKLLQVTTQVTFASARRVTSRIQAMSGTSVRFGTDALVALLSHSLQATIAGHDLQPRPSGGADADGEEENIREGSSAANNSCQSEGPVATPQVVQLVTDVLETTADLMLNYVLFHRVREHRVDGGLMVVRATRQNRTSGVVGGDSAAVYLPDSLILHLLRRGGEPRSGRPCVLAVLTEFAQSPFVWARHHERLNGPVVDLNLYKCSTRRKIPVRSLVEPVTVELRRIPLPPPPNISEHLHTLRRRKIHYHSFNITQEHLRDAIQIRVRFRRPHDGAFPVMLLFRMSERPTPSTHHLSRTHRWEGDAVTLALPSSFLRNAGVGHLALLDANFAGVSRREGVGEQVAYSLSVDSSACWSLDARRTSWTRGGCGALQTEATAAVNCSCDRLGPTTVVRRRIRTSCEAADLDLFLSVPSNPTVLCVLLLCLCLYIPGWAACRRADAVSEAHRGVHHLSDNSPHDSHLYAVTIHTGPWSAARMSAKVYIALYGEDGVSQTKELQVPGCTLFRRNSQDTFIVSAADSLGPVWGVHIWHDNSGSSPSWYLKQVEVREVTPGVAKGPSWLFGTPRWLSVDKGDGRVERTLRTPWRGASFPEMLQLRLSEYLADHHIWTSLLCCPRPHPFTQTQRLGVSLLMLLGCAAVNAAAISRLEGQLPFDVGALEASALSLKTGVLGALLTLPAAASVAFLFRLREVGPPGSGAPRKTVCPGDVLPGMGSTQHRPSWIQLWTHESWGKKPPLTPRTPLLLVDAISSVPEGSGGVRRAPGSAPKAEDGDEEEKGPRGNQRPRSRRRGGPSPVSQWCHHLAWTLCVLLSVSCLACSAALGDRLSGGQAVLWTHSLFFSLTSSFFLIQPAAIATAAVVVSLWCKEKADVRGSSTKGHLEPSVCPPPDSSSRCPADGPSYLQRLLRDRRRVRYLRLVRPPSPAELRKSRQERRRDALLLKTVRDLFFCGSMLFLMVCSNQSDSVTDRHRLEKAIMKQFMSRGQDNGFLSVQTHQDWWKWAQTHLNSLYKDASASPQLHVLIGEPVVWKLEESSSHGQVSGVALLSERLHSFLTGSRRVAAPGGPNATVGLGYTKSEALSTLKGLRSGGWLNGRPSAAKLRFTLFSPVANLFASVTAVAKQRPTGVLQPSVEVHAAQVYRTPAPWDYVVMVSQLLYILLSLVQLSDQVRAVVQQGIVGYWRAPCNWLEVGLVTATLLHHVSCLRRSVVILEVAQLLRGPRGRVDVAPLAACEQRVRSLRGAALFLLTMKAAAALRVFGTTLRPAALLAASLSKLFWPTVSGIILTVALSSAGHFLSGQSADSTTFFGSLKSPLCHRRGLSAVRGLRSSWGLYLSALVWAPAAMAVVSSLVTRARRCQHREDGFTVAQIVSYVTRRHKNLRIKNQVEEKTYYFEEFEGLLDELLFRLGALSNSLHHSLPPKAHHYREDSPVSTSISAHVDPQFYETQMREESIEEILPASPLLLPKREMDESTQELQPNFKTPLQHPDPAAPTCRRWLSESPAAQKKLVLVEVLIHKDPSSEPGSQDPPKSPPDELHRPHADIYLD